MAKQQQQTYTCPLSGRIYKTKRGALRSEEREQRKDYIRLHTTTPQHFVELLVSKGKEFWGWDVEVDLERVEVCKESSWSDSQDLGVRVRLNVRLDCNRRVAKNQWLTDYLRSHINGLGRYDRSWHRMWYAKTTAVPETLWLPFSEFPLMSENYNKYCAQKDSTYEWLNEKSRVTREGSYFATSREEYKELDAEIQKINKIRDELIDRQNEIVGYFKKGYVSLWECQNPAPQKDSDLCRAFGNY